LYTLLQDSPEENELLRAMGRVVAKLLTEGEMNVTGDCTPKPAITSNGSLPDPTTELAAHANTMAEIDETSKVASTSEQSNGTPTAALDKKDNTDKVPKSPQLIEAPNTPPNELTGNGPQLLDTTNTPENVSEAPTRDLDGLSIDESEVVSKNTEDTEQPLPIAPESNSGAIGDLPGLDSEIERQEKWFLTFEQFVSGLNQEPDLCQFFAEQNLIDLSGSTSVDPVLSSYTRTVIASSPL